MLIIKMIFLDSKIDIDFVNNAMGWKCWKERVWGGVNHPEVSVLEQDNHSAIDDEQANQADNQPDFCHVFAFN